MRYSLDTKVFVYQTGEPSKVAEDSDPPKIEMGSLAGGCAKPSKVAEDSDPPKIEMGSLVGGCAKPSKVAENSDPPKTG